MSRRIDREHAFCMVFQREFNNQNPPYDDLEYYLAHFAENGCSEKDFVLGEVEGVFEHLADIDACIGEHCVDWELSRLTKVDLAVMRLAVYEIFYAPKIHESISINEAVELAKAYSSDEAGKFVNGVLGKIVRSSL